MRSMIGSCIMTLKGGRIITALPSKKVSGNCLNPSPWVLHHPPMVHTPTHPHHHQLRLPHIQIHIQITPTLTHTHNNSHNLHRPINLCLPWTGIQIRVVRMSPRWIVNHGILHNAHPHQPCPCPPISHMPHRGPLIHVCMINP